jgi:hypothetical protein
MIDETLIQDRLSDYRKVPPAPDIYWPERRDEAIRQLVAEGKK